MPKFRWSAKEIPSKCVAIDSRRTHYTFEGVEGLVLDCLANGKRLWKVRYDITLEGRRVSRKMTLGTLDLEAMRHAKQDGLDLLTPGAAKDRALIALSKARAGSDPWLEGKNAKTFVPESVVTFGAAFAQWLDDPSRAKVLRPRSRVEYVRIFERHIKARLGRIDIKQLDRATISQAIDEIRAATTDPERGHRGLQATKALTVIHAVCEWTTGKAFTTYNVARGIKRPVPVANPNGKANRPLSEEELKQVWTEAPSHLATQIVRVLKLALLLGKRVSEIAGARKSEVSLDTARWLIPATREGNKSRHDHLVPLPPIAVEIFREAIEASKFSDYVFPARMKDDRPMSRHTPSQAFAEFRTKLGISDRVRFHDARGLINDQMSNLEVPSEYRSHVLNHTGDMRATLASTTYSTYDFEPQKRKALELWALRLLEIVDGRAKSGLRWN